MVVSLLNALIYVLPHMSDRPRIGRTQIIYMLQETLVFLEQGFCSIPDLQRSCHSPLAVLLPSMSIALLLIWQGRNRLAYKYPLPLAWARRELDLGCKCTNSNVLGSQKLDNKLVRNYGEVLPRVPRI